MYTDGKRPLDGVTEPKKLSDQTLPSIVFLNSPPLSGSFHQGPTRKYPSVVSVSLRYLPPLGAPWTWVQTADLQ